MAARQPALLSFHLLLSSSSRGPLAVPAPTCQAWGMGKEGITERASVSLSLSQLFEPDALRGAAAEEG